MTCGDVLSWRFIFVIIVLPVCDVHLSIIKHVCIAQEYHCLQPVYVMSSVPHAFSQISPLLHFNLLVFFFFKLVIWYLSSITLLKLINNKPVPAMVPGCRSQALTEILQDLGVPESPESSLNVNAEGPVPCPSPSSCQNRSSSCVPEDKDELGNQVGGASCATDWRTNSGAVSKVRKICRGLVFLQHLKIIRMHLLSSPVLFATTFSTVLP